MSQPRKLVSSLVPSAHRLTAVTMAVLALTVGGQALAQDTPEPKEAAPAEAPKAVSRRPKTSRIGAAAAAVAAAGSRRAKGKDAGEKEKKTSAKTPKDDKSGKTGKSE